MSLNVQVIEREFVYEGTVLDDPDSSMSPAEVKEFYAGIYPQLTQSVIEEKIDGTKVIYTFRKAVGTKG